MPTTPVESDSVDRLVSPQVQEPMFSSTDISSSTQVKQMETLTSNNSTISVFVLSTHGMLTQSKTNKCSGASTRGMTTRSKTRSCKPTPIYALSTATTTITESSSVKPAMAYSTWPATMQEEPGPGNK